MTCLLFILTGVHSVYDLIAGAILGVTMMLFLHSYGDSLDVLLYQFSGAIYVQLLLLMVYFGNTAYALYTLHVQFAFRSYFVCSFEYYDASMHFSHSNPFISLPHIQLFFFLYTVFYPRAGPWSASMGTAAQMMGPFFGCGVSLW